MGMQEEAAAMAFDEAEPLFWGHYQLTREWAMVLPARLRRKIEDDRVILWRPYVQIYLDASGYGKKGSKQLIHERFMANHEKMAFGTVIVQESWGTLRRGCTMMEKNEDGVTEPCFSGWVAGETGFVTMQMYYADIFAEPHAWGTWQSIRPVPPVEDLARLG